MARPVTDFERSPAPGMGIWRWVRRIVLTLIGVPVLLVGVVMLVTPGPGVALIAAGLAILAVEFVWAERQLDKVRRMTRKVIDKARRTDDHTVEDG